METGAGDAPSPPPRRNTPRTAKMAAGTLVPSTANGAAAVGALARGAGDTARLDETAGEREVTAAIMETTQVNAAVLEAAVGKCEVMAAMLETTAGKDAVLEATAGKDAVLETTAGKDAVLEATAGKRGATVAMLEATVINSAMLEAPAAMLQTTAGNDAMLEAPAGKHEVTAAMLETTQVNAAMLELPAGKHEATAAFMEPTGVNAARLEAPAVMLEETVGKPEAVAATMEATAVDAATLVMPAGKCGARAAILEVAAANMTILEASAANAVSSRATVRPNTTPNPESPLAMGVNEGSTPKVASPPAAILEHAMANPVTSPMPATGLEVSSGALGVPPAPAMSFPAPLTPPALQVVAPSPGTPDKASPTASTALQDLGGSLSSLGPGIPAPRARPAPDTLSYLESVSLMSGTLESLTSHGFPDDASSLGSDSEINGLAYRRTDKYGFLGGAQYSEGPESALPVDVARQRELKWLDMFSHWDKWLSRRFQKVKLRCRKGIPSSLRAKAWQLLSNSKELLEQNPEKFEELERQPGDPKWLDVIEKDLHRQFPFHEMFAARGGHGQQDLYRILKAYTVYRPDEGYCQAQAPVAAVLLMHMPAEQAFWCLVQICEKYLPGYYSAGLEAIQLDGEIFFALLRRACPIAYRHLKKFKIDPILYMTEWFMCVFSRTLPWSSVLRVWDMFFCEGVKIIFRVGLVLLRSTLGSVDKLRSCQGMYETMEKLRNPPLQCLQEEVLVHEVVSLPVTEALIERESGAQLKKWRETRGELQHKPSRRLHGSRAIHEERHRLHPPPGASPGLLGLAFKPRPQPPRPTLAPLAAAAAPPAASGQVVSEGLHPALPSPTGNNAPLGGPHKGAGPPQRDTKGVGPEDKKKREKEEKARLKQEKKREKEREKEEKKREKKEKKEKKTSFRRREPPKSGGVVPEDGEPGAGGSTLQDTYF
ncbi:TBC1 domain family member 10B [Alligator mississippiensis]|uniref:TBC1 domain family member 10B n=1 Tax=Alligator mississippiensis TaxID=8496 RepID=UPI0028774C81|nr:TBC1 domain family member 10B [Alligator mississippiensis]